MSNHLESKEPAPQPVYPSSCIYLSNAGKKGLGVFAARAINRSELVEECPVSPLKREEEKLVENNVPVLKQYLFLWDDIFIDSGAAVVWGFGSFYNHSKAPNLELHYDEPQRRLRFVALRDIEEHEELTFDYVVPLWFEDTE
jgi:SET domain-containing protein